MHNRTQEAICTKLQTANPVISQYRALIRNHIKYFQYWFWNRNNSTANSVTNATIDTLTATNHRISCGPL